MSRSRLTALKPRQLGGHFATCVLALTVLLASLPIQGQTADPQNLATLQGIVRDATGSAIAGVTVVLRNDKGKTIQTVTTDTEGMYRCSALPAGDYELHAEMPGYGEANFGPFALERNRSKKIDFMLTPKEIPGPNSSAAATLQFFDKPEFTVAGVTETMNLGGHGSDIAMRTREALTKEVISLAREPRGDSHAAPSLATTKENLRESTRREPENFEACYRLGKMLVDKGKALEAIAYLERAAELQPNDFESSFELARAYVGAGRYEKARTEIQSLLAQQDKSELHHLLGDLEEQSGKPLEAVREYQRAAELNPSEPNIFDWGAELLVHRAIEPAIQVFKIGNRRFPRSVRLLAALGVAWYASGSYDQAARRLCEASDLKPENPQPYLLLGKMQAAESESSDVVVEKLQRFVKLQPENALANYYYALCLWKRRRDLEDTQDLARLRSLLEKAVRLDPKLGAAYLQLGILYAEQEDFPKAISEYQKSVETSPELEEAHYRLAQVYRQTGEMQKAREELKLYEQISKKAAEESGRHRRELLQFVYTLRGQTDASQPQ